MIRRPYIWLIVSLAGALVAGAVLSLVAFAALGYLGPRPSPTPEPSDPFPPTSTQSSQPIPITGLIQGSVWHDLCAVGGGHGNQPLAPSPGCVQLPDGNYLANGNFEPGEPGLGGARVQLGAGPCPSTGLATTTTNPDGSYQFAELSAGPYCISVAADAQPAMQMVPGYWTSPPGFVGANTVYRGVELAEGQTIAFIDFGWDYFLLPVVDEPPAPPTATPTPASLPCTNQVAFVNDVTIPDNTRLNPGQTFRKTWRLRNAGTCPWTPDYALAFASGHNLGGAIPMPLGVSVAPGATLDVFVDLRAPQATGTYRANWMLRSPAGVLFGVGPNANDVFWVQILVGTPGSASGGWYAEYYDNRTLSGQPKAVRYDEEIDFDWGRDAPLSGIPADNFSVRWTATVHFEEGTYQFVALADDGVRLWVDDKLIIDAWRDQDSRTIDDDHILSKGNHTLKLEYYDHNKEAVIRLTWTRLGSSSYPDWKGEYYINRDLSGAPILVRNDRSVDFDWGNGSPDSAVPSDSFSARWTRRMSFEAGRYRLNLRADDGVRLYVNGTRVINEWHDSSGSEVYTVEMNLSGQTDLQMDYYERSGKARVKFSYERVTPTATPTPSATASATATVAPATDTPAPTLEAPTATQTPEEPTVTPSPTLSCIPPDCVEPIREEGIFWRWLRSLIG